MSDRHRHGLGTKDVRTKISGHPPPIKSGDRAVGTVVKRFTTLKTEETGWGTRISETKCTCDACGRTWFYGKLDESKGTSAALPDLGKSKPVSSCCLSAIVIPNQETIDINKCPGCGSRAVSKQRVVHAVSLRGELCHEVSPTPSDPRRDEKASARAWTTITVSGAVIVALWIYQKLLSPVLRRWVQCRFYPTCSEYAVLAVRKEGPQRGLAQAYQRVLRCRPDNLESCIDFP